MQKNKIEIEVSGLNLFIFVCVNVNLVKLYRYQLSELRGADYRVIRCKSHCNQVLFTW